MRTRSAITALLVVAVALFAAACGSDTTSTNTASGGATTTAKATGNGSNNTMATLPGGVTLPGNVTMPSLPPGVTLPGNLNQCYQIAGTFAGLATLAMSGPDGAKKAQDQADALKAQVPSDLAGDVDNVAQAYATIASQGLVAGGQALSDSKYSASFERLSNYFKTKCAVPTTK